MRDRVGSTWAWWLIVSALAQTPGWAQEPGRRIVEAESPIAPERPAELDATWKPIGPSLWFQPAQRKLAIESRIVLRNGPLEHLLCLFQSKEHESILATNAEAYQIHSGLLLCGLQAGQPVRFRPEFRPPTGDPIRIQARWTDSEGDVQTVDARTWVRNPADGTLLETDWVFAGSEYYNDPITDERIYSASVGDLITVANFSSAILDLPFASSADDTALVFEANTPLIPTDRTRVVLVLQAAADPNAEESPKAEAPKPATSSETPDTP